MGSMVSICTAIQSIEHLDKYYDIDSFEYRENLLTEPQEYSGKSIDPDQMVRT
jgi:hypothetical protein